MNIRTDLALEAMNMTKTKSQDIKTEIEEENGIRTERVEIISDEAAEKIGKSQGRYVTVSVRDLSENDRDDYENVCMCVARELKGILNIEEKAPVLVVGLGNEAITADSIGPKSVKKLLVTRHIKEMLPDEVDPSVRSVSAIAPSVMAMTGIETETIVSGIVGKIKPKAVIAVDALAARSMKRLGRTIQITDTGINPGSGVGNNRKELSMKTLGIPVIAIGVPTVADASTVLADCMGTITESEEERERFEKLYKKAAQGEADMVVTGKDIDSLSERCARIIANGINIALQKGMGKDDIDRYSFA